MRNSLSLIAVWGSISLTACAGAQKNEPESAHTVASQPSVETQPKVASSPPSTDSQPKSEPASGSVPPATEEDTAIRKASRPPFELLSAPDVAFVLNFKESAPGIEAQTRCDEQASEDPQANRACLANARSKIPIELTRFEKDASGQWWWVTYNRFKGNLLKWHKIQFRPGEETPSSIVLKPFGEDKGAAPMGRVPSSLEIELPNDYSIVMNDREHGRLVFDAKIGMVRAEN